MAVKKQDWELSQRGLKDAARHREKVRESIRQNIAEIIGEESIITRKEGQIVKVPIRGVKSYQFIYKRESSGGVGVGQGKAGKGDAIGKQPSPDGQPGQPGDRPGVDYLETEIEIEQLIEMMLEDLGLPNLKEKAFTETIIPKGWKQESIEKVGILPHLDRKRTLKAAVKRTATFVEALMKKTGQPKEACQMALAEAKGDLLTAEEILQKGRPEKPGEPLVRLYNEDLRYRVLERDIEYESNAVVLAMMDVSGSMTTMKKYMARSFFFWLVEFLKQLYKNVQIRFIAHTTEAKLVDEHEFFHRGESGGTLCHSALDLSVHLVETEYNPSRWNIYPILFSDGEDFEPMKSVASVQRLMQLGVNLVGYGEIEVDPYSSSKLMETFSRELRLVRHAGRGGLTLYVGGETTVPFIGAVLQDKSHVYPALKEFLRKERPF